MQPASTKSADSCGRSGATSGTEGTLDLYDGKTKICTIYWSCPWGTTVNDFQIRGYEPTRSDYSVTVGTWARTGALGNVDITVAMFA